MTISIACAGLAFGGFTWLAQTIDRHHADMHGRGTEPDRVRIARLRAQGYLALALALGACVVEQGWAFGLLYWTGLLTVTAWGTVAIFACAPRLSGRLALIAAGVSAIAVGVLMQS